MKNKVKKIVTATILSALSFTAIGCGTNSNKTAQKVNAMAISNIQSPDYTITNKPNEKVGKLVETSSQAGQTKYMASTDTYLSKGATYNTIENTITKPESTSGSFKLFVLSDSPFITLSTGDNMANLSIKMRFTTQSDEEASSEIHEKINKLMLKRSILMVYVNEIYNGKVNLSEENKAAINSYIDSIKENTNNQSGRNMEKNQQRPAEENDEENQNGNANYIRNINTDKIKETRMSRLDSSISAIDSIINIIESNLSSTSAHYHNRLSDTYDRFLSNISKTSETSQNINANSNQEIAKNIAKTLNLVQIKAENDKNCEICEKDQNQNMQEKNNISNPSTSVISPKPSNQINQSINHSSSQTSTINRQTNTISNSSPTSLGNTNQGTYTQNGNFGRYQASTSAPTIKPAPVYIDKQQNNNYPQNNSTNGINSIGNQLNQNSKENNYLDRQKIMRAKRTPEQEKQEEYTSSSNNSFDFANRNSTSRIFNH